MSSKGNKPSVLVRHKSSDLRQNSKVQVGSKTDRNLSNKGIKRRRSSDGEACPSDKKSKGVSEAKPKDSGSTGSLAQNRLSNIRKDKKDTQYSSRSAVCPKKSSRPPWVKDTQVNFHNNIDLVKNGSNNTDDETQTKHVKSTNFIKKSINDRLKLVKKCGVLNPVSHNAEKINTVILKSPETSNCSLKGSISNEKLPTSPLERLYCTEINSAQGIGSECTSLDVLTPEASAELSFFTISEAKSDGGSSSKNVTPLTQRLINIRKRFSSTSSDKTLTPGSPNESLNGQVNEHNFKRSTRSPTVGSGLKIPLNRDLFKNRTEDAVQTKRNNFRSPTDEEPDEKDVKVSTGRGANRFQSYRANPVRADRSFSQANTHHHSPNRIVDAAKEIESSFDKPTISVPKSIFDNVNVTHRPIHDSEPENSEICSRASQIFPSKRVQSPKKSATDRIKRIKNESCSTSTYKKNEKSMFHSSVPENLASSQPTVAQLVVSNLSENRMVGIRDIQGSLQSPESPSNRPTFAKEYLTNEWTDANNHGSMTNNNPMSDSLVVNVDDTILNKSDLPDPIEDVSMDWDETARALRISVPTVAKYRDGPQERFKRVPRNYKRPVTDIQEGVQAEIQNEIYNMYAASSRQAKIYVPWMVLKELDHIKDRNGEPVRSYALNAEKFINNYVGSPDSKVLGQTVQAASEQQDIGICPDDKILSCCLQAVKKYETVILLSNDINLRNKAIINQIVACTPHQIISTLKSIKFCNISSELVALWSKIISECCEQTYGRAWQKMDSLQNATLLECMKRFKKYWGSVFREVLLKQTLKPLELLLDFLLKHKGDVPDDSHEFETFKKLVSDFSINLQDLPAHREQVREIIRTINRSDD